MTADESFAAEQRERGYDAGLRAAREGVMRTETSWPQPRRDGYAAEWRHGTERQQESAA